MTFQEALDAVRQAGAYLLLDNQGPIIRGRVPPNVVAVLREHRDRVAALLRLRQLHEAMGLGPDDVAMIELAMLEGRINDVQIIVPAPTGTRPA